MKATHTYDFNTKVWTIFDIALRWSAAMAFYDFYRYITPLA